MDPARDRKLLVDLCASLETPARAAGLTGTDRTVTLARHHRLSPLLGVVAGGHLDPSLAEVCRRDRVVTAARNLMLAGVAEACLQALAKAGVPVVLLKGLAYEASIYADCGGGVRPSADVDVLVPGSGRRAAFEVLDRLGFEPRAAAPGFDEPDYHEVAWTRDGVEVDLHMALAPLARCGIDYDELWSEVGPSTLGHTPTSVLSPPHSAVFHALHMAIDHFDLPALYLVDLARLLPDPATLAAAQSAARAWRCSRPLETAVAITAAFLPLWAASHHLPVAPQRAADIASSYGSTARVPRTEQLRRKFSHFDVAADAVRYALVQARRNAREVIERRVRGRSARKRLSLAARRQ